MNYSVAQLEELSRSNPEGLAQLISNHITDITTLAAAIEILGETSLDETIVLPIFRRLLRHIHMSVRESALSAVSLFYNNRKPPTDILDRVSMIAKSDPSTTVRDYAEGLLKDFSKLP